MPGTQNNFKSGFVTLVGRPNAGKSTLLNALIGTKVAITSDVVQTTRHRIRGILNKEGMQAIFIDTPGLHKPVDVLGQELNEGVFQAIADCDIVCMLIDASQKIGKGDAWVAEKIHKLKSKKFCILTKTDLVDADTKMAQVARASELENWDALICLSAVKNYKIDAFIEEVEHFLPEGPMWFPQDTNTDQPIEVMIAEYIREKIIRNVFEEVPHSVGLEVVELSFDEKKRINNIYAHAFVEHESQKGILIGKGGQTIKKISTEAREDLEKLLGTKVFLDLEIKVKKDWRRDYNQVRKFGYTAE